MISELFKEQVSARGNCIAIHSNSKQLSYNELDDLSDRVCVYLQSKNLQTGSVVGVIGSRSWEFVVAIVGIMKAGCIYLPIDTGIPEKRIDFMLTAADSKLVIRLDNAEALVMEGSRFAEITALPASAGFAYKEHNNAYIMYTSGSTGQPKGVLINKKGIVRLVKKPDFIVLNEQTRILLTGSISFDASTFEIFAAILNGGSLYIGSNKMLMDAAILKEFINTHQINTMWLTSPLFNQLIDTDELLFNQSSVRCLLVGGDVLSPRHINLVLQHNPELAIINGYGPTENTVFSATYKITKPVEGPTVPIGSAIRGSEVYILRDTLEPAASFEKGKIFVSGKGLMEGYVNDTALTNQWLINNPFVPGSKMYDTGDIGYWDNNHLLYFSGRADGQIKINGYRIETTEIGHHIAGWPSVKHAFVHYFRDAGLLTAYVVRANDSYSKEALTKYLEDLLPEYMLPHAILELASFPLNSNGKIDIPQLPYPVREPAMLTSQQNIATRLIGIFSALLKKELDASNLSDNFFDLGGNSIKLFKLLHEIEKEFGVTVGMKDFFEQQTMAYLLKKIESGENIAGGSKIPLAPKKEFYKPSTAQRRLYFLHELNKKSVAYNITSAYKIHGTITAGRISSIFQQLLEVHETLRTRLVLRENEMFQVVSDNAAIVVEELALAGISTEQAISGFVRPFDLSRQPIRVGIIEQDDASKILVVDVHHCMFDGLSLKIVIEDFYRLLEGASLPARKITYKDFSEWQASPQFQAFKDQQKRFWLSVFADRDLPRLDIPADKPRPRVFSSAGGTVDFSFGPELSARLREIAIQHGITHFMVLYLLFDVLLYKLTGASDIVIGVPVSGRSSFECETLVGLFVNTLAFRVEIEKNKSFSEHLVRTKDFCFEAFANQDYPLEELIDSVKADRDASRNPLFDVMFAFNDFDIASPAAQNHVTVKLSPYRIKRQSSNFDLCLIAAESEGLFKFSLQYYSDIFEQSTIQSFVNCFLTISEMVSAKPDSPLSGIEIAAPAPIPVIHPTVKHEDPAMETIPGLFQKQAKQSPGSTAIIYNSQVINYQQLLNRSLAFAEAIDSRHIQKKSVIAIRAERGPEMISAMLGVMFAGCLYLPIDPQLSTERAAAIFKNADAAAAIILPGDGLADFATNTILIGTVPVKPTMAFQLTQVCGTDIAYVIYTSGSTGEPKGVAIQHQSIVNTLRWRMQYYHFNESDVTLQIPSYYFDSSVEDIFTTLISGGALVLTSERIFKDLDFFVEICTKNKVTNLLMIPSLYSEVLYRLKDAVNLSLRFVTLAGESIGENIVRRHFNIMPAVELYNEYGPTECSVCATVYRFSPTHTKVFIGKPITGIDCMVLNKDLNNCPAGIAGELYLSGIGLAKGYYNKPEETKSRFIQNIFGGGLMYATGDMVKRNADGNLEFLGRFDDQLKIRGYRIELQEIEHQIRQIAMVKEVVVVQQQAGNMLVGYFTAVEKISAERLKNVLEFKLPMYMIPASLIQLEEFPRTSNGKISRKALADRVIVRSEVNTKIKAVTELEKKLLYSWRGIVGIDSIGVLDNFFETGGNSINVLSFQHLINKEIGVLIPVDRFFQYANISRLAAFIAGQTQVLPLQHQPVSDLADTLDLFNQDV